MPPDTTNSIFAAILAAGASRRMGSAKALLKFGGRTALECSVATIRAAGIVNIIIVTGLDAAVAAHAESLGQETHGLLTIQNANPGAGRTGSLQLALSVIPVHSAVLLFPIDCPLVSHPTIASITDPRIRAEVVRPRYNGKCGHPVLFQSSLQKEILKLEPDDSLRTIVHRDPSRRVEIDVTDSEILTNLDTPEDYQNALDRYRKNLNII